MPIFADKIFWDAICELNHVFCRSISIPANNVLDVAALTDVADNFVNDIQICISRMWLVLRFSRVCFVCVFVGNLFCLVQFLMRTAISSGRWRTRYTVYEDFVWDAVLVYGYGISSHFQDAVRSGCLPLKFVVRVARQNVWGRFWCCC